MEYIAYRLSDLLGNYDYLRKPLSSMEREFFQGSYPYYGAQGIIDYVQEYRCDGEYLLIAEDGENLMSRAQPIATIAQGKFWVNNHAHIVKTNCLADMRYLCYALNHLDITGYVTGSAQPKLSQGNLNKIKILLPSIDKQKEVVSVLSAYDNLIEVNNKRIKVLERMAENLYKEWFVRFRFPGHETTEFVNGIPKGWEYKKLDKLLDVRYGKDHKIVGDGNIPVFGSGGLMRYGERALYDGESVLIPRKGSLNNIMYYNAPFWTVDTMFYSIPLISNFAKYAYYMLSHVDMDSYNSGAALPSMTTDILYHFKVLVPNEGVLKAFDKFASDTFEQINAIKRVNDNLVQQRDLLLPRLMSGKLEV